MQELAMTRYPTAARTVAACLATALWAQCALAAPAYDVAGKDVATLGAAMSRHEVSSAQLVDAYVARIRQFDVGAHGLHSVIALNPQARAQAAALDRERAAGHLRGPLHGIPLLVKDNIETADPLPTTAGSLALRDNLTRRDSPLVAKLRAAGAVVLGKTNLSEWANIRSAWSMSGWSAVGGLVRNPHDRARSACGSSSGSAAAVAASFAPAAIGTETDGSVTCPASMTGLVGIKPTVGLVSRTFVVPISHSQDTPGPITRTVADAALLLGVMAGSDPADSATRDADARLAGFAAGTDALPLAGRRFGVLRVEGALPQTQALFEGVLARLRAAGATAVEVDRPAESARLGDYELTVLLTELKADLDAYLAGTPPAVHARSLAQLIEFNRAHAAEELPLFGQDLFERAAATGGLQDEAYVTALREERRIAGPDGLDARFAALKLDAILAPTFGPAFLTDTVNGDAMNGGGPGNLPAIAGYPHLTLQMGLVKGLPVGLSLIGPAWSDARLLGLAAAIAPLLPPVPLPQLGASARAK
jgi:amidase